MSFRQIRPTAPAVNLRNCRFGAILYIRAKTRFCLLQSLYSQRFLTHAPTTRGLLEHLEPDDSLTPTTNGVLCL